MYLASCSTTISCPSIYREVQLSISIHDTLSVMLCMVLGIEQAWVGGWNEEIADTQKDLGLGDLFSQQRGYSTLKYPRLY